jgi:hypothetical protein
VYTSIKVRNVLTESKFEAVVEPNKRYALVGAIVMETLDLIVEPRSLQLYPNPRSKLPMAEIE